MTRPEQQSGGQRRAILAGAVAATGVCVLAWLSGYDFNERGPTALIVGMLVVWAGWAAWLISPGNRP